MATMNTEPDPPRSEPPEYPAITPVPSLWATWSPARILGLAVLLMLGDFALQIIFYALGGGLFLPVLLGTIGGVFVPLYLITGKSHVAARRDLSLYRPPPLVIKQP